MVSRVFGIAADMRLVHKSVDMSSGLGGTFRIISRSFDDCVNIRPKILMCKFFVDFIVCEDVEFNPRCMSCVAMRYFQPLVLRGGGTALVSAIYS